MELVIGVICSHQRAPTLGKEHGPTLSEQERENEVNIRNSTVISREKCQ
jgi:hypothetical protein